LWSSAPPPIDRRLAACYGLLLGPAIVGALSEWPWECTVALLLPGLVLQGWLSHIAAREYGIRRTFVIPSGTRMVLGGAIGLLGMLAANIRPTYLAPLGFVLILLVVADPVWRIAWKRAHSSA
jgi:hypothetical protein